MINIDIVDDESLSYARLIEELNVSAKYVKRYLVVYFEGYKPECIGQKW
jgi:hypothetical protein